MKKILITAVLYLLTINTALAQSPKPFASPTPLPKKTIDYMLPYPGVLPDNALYKLKMVRDRIGAWFIRDPLRLSEYFLKMGDKRANAAKFLAEGGKWELAATTASKAEIYLLRSFEQARLAKTKGEDTAAFLGKLSTASLKHEEVLTDMWGRAPDGPKQSFEKSLIVTRDVYKNVQELLGVTVKNEASPSPKPIKE